MPSILLTAPAVEPVSLDEAKAYLRVEHSDDDEVIAALVAGSRIHVEAQTRRALITQEWRISADAWPPDGRMPVRPGPLQALGAVRVYDFDNAAQDVDIVIVGGTKARWRLILDTAEEAGFLEHGVRRVGGMKHRLRARSLALFRLEEGTPTETRDATRQRRDAVV